MDLDTLRFLQSSDGEGLLRYAESLQGSLLTRISTLRKRYPPRVAASAVELIELRRKAAKKFSLAHRMFFTREALEQASSETISRYRAERFQQDTRVLDLACGVGGDTIGLATRCYVTAVDRDPLRLAMAEHNIRVYGLSHRVEFVCADATEIPLEADAAFLDPSRRAGGRRVFRLEEMSPPLSFLRRLVREVPDCAIKLSPATEYDELLALDGEIEFIGESGECKEALVWFGRFRTASRRATILPARVSIAAASDESGSIVPVRGPGRYLYEPDPCVIRAHLVEHLAAMLALWKIDTRIAYLSSDELVTNPFTRPYEIVESLPFNLKALKNRLAAIGAGRVVVKKRGVPFEPQEMERQLRRPGGREIVVVLTRVSGNPWALICDPVASAGPGVEYEEH